MSSIPSVFPHCTQLHHATIIRRNKVLASAYNKIGSRSRGCGYSDRTIHAEHAVIKRLGDLRQLKGATLIVVRYGHNGDVKSSKPCHDCQLFLEKCMRDYGLLKVIYS
jgi:Cytidine and deoxycytidylate deaminase zinc-binding region